MFGYVTIYRNGLDEAALDCYQAYYCGLCRVLRQHYGAVGQLALSFDSTFMALLHSALYEPETQYSRGRCLLHPAKTRPRAVNEFQHYAADMTALLAYYNFLDDWQDEKRRLSLEGSRKLEPYMAELRQRYPRQCRDVQQQLENLSALEKAGSTNLDAFCEAFGGLLGSVFIVKEDEWAPLLDQMGRGLGGFIYLMDAYEDLEKDRKKDCFNPLASLYESLSPAEYEARCRQLLTEQMAQCAAAFEMLPILKSTPEGQLLYNVIYSGIWSKHALLEAKHKANFSKEKRNPDERSV